jgi:PAS domain S-box-containing protein
MHIDEAALEEARAILMGLAASHDKEHGWTTDSPPPEPPPLPPAQLALPEWSLQGYSDLVDALPDGVVIINQAGAIVLVNQQTLRLFGYTRAELLGQAVEVLVPERFRGGHVALRQAYFTEPHRRAMGAAGVELTGRRKDGGLFPVEISLSPQRTDSGLLVVAVVRDITARKREEAKFRTLVENIPAVTFIAPLDDSAPQFYVSPQIEQLLGFSQQEWLADPVLWHRQLHPADQERWNVEFAATCNSGKPFRSTYRFIAKDGRVVWVHGSANVVRGGDGQLLFLQGVAFDVTKIKEAEEALLRSNAELDRLVNEKTEELTEKAKKLQQFAKAAVHDIKRQLRGILIPAQEAVEGLVDEARQVIAGREPVYQKVRKIVDTSDSMTRLINKLYQYGTVSHSERMEPVDCAEVVAQARLLLDTDILQSGAVLDVGSLPTVLGVRDLLVLLFENLISNAIKYREPRRPLRVTITAERCPGGWRFSVRDNGVGIEARHLDGILNKPLGQERRMHPKIDGRKIEGWGYGLATCQETVARHGGRLQVESTFGQGSTFSFILPASPSDESAG